MHSSALPRRRHSPEFKQEVLAACAEPGASVAAVAAVARSFGLNDNLVHQWRRGRGSAVRAAVDACPAFVALTLSAQLVPEPAVAAPFGDIRVEVTRGPLSVAVTWPGAAAAELAVWMRELLR